MVRINTNVVSDSSAGYGYSYGAGYGYGDGYGAGDGSGAGYGYSYGAGYGDGSGYGQEDEQNKQIQMMFVKSQETLADQIKSNLRIAKDTKK